MEQRIKVVLTGSLIGTKPNQRATAAPLGLKKIGDFFIGRNDPALLGKVKVLRHLVKVEPVSTVTE